MTQAQGHGVIDQLLDATLARVIVTYDGQTGDMADPVSADAAHDDVRRMVQEALRTGGVQGIPALPDADLTDFVVDPVQASESTPYRRLLVRPKTAFGVGA